MTRIILRLGLASILGGILGYERELKAKSAGIRTHMLVAVGAALCVLIAAGQRKLTWRNFRVSVAESFATTRVRTETPMGIIITAVAVFDTHMDRKPVAIMNPPTTPPGLVPMARTVTSAILRCRFHRCMARARMNPPMNRKMMLLP